MSDEDLAALVAILKNATHTGAFKAGLAQAISYITTLRARLAQVEGENAALNKALNGEVEQATNALLRAEKAEQELATAQQENARLREALALLLSDIDQGADPLDVECRRVTGSYDKARTALGDKQ